MMLSSGLGIYFLDASDDSVVGAGITATWRVPEQQEDQEELLSGVTQREWLNAAADVAQEATRDPLERTVIWRDLHFQLIRHLCCRVARRQGRCAAFEGLSVSPHSLCLYCLSIFSSLLHLLQ